MTKQFELSEFLNVSAPVKPRHFLGADNADEIEAILTEREGHSLHEFIDGDEPLRPVIDFDLPIETLNAITPKLSGGQAKNSLYCAFRDTCLEIFPEWDKETLTIAESSDKKKISLHVSTFGMRLPNTAQVAMFTELVRKKLLTALQENSIIDNIANKCSFSLQMLGSPKYNEKTGEHIHVKKAIRPKDGTIFDFMIRPSNDESEVIKNSPLLVVLKAKMERCSSTNNVITNAEFELVETLLQEASIEGYSLSYPSENFSNKFPLSRISPSHCPICDREYDSDHGYIIRNKKSYSFFCYWVNNNREPGSKKPSKKLTIIYEAIQATVACIQTTSRLWVLKIEDTNGRLYFDIALKLDLAKYEVNLLELGFLAKPAVEINPKIIDPILWHTKNIISNENSTLQKCGKNIITDFIGDKVLGEYLHYATSDLEKILGRFNSAIQARKLIVMNETGMSSGEWHKFNGHLKSLITEGMVSIERKGIETKRIRDFTRFMVTSNQDAPLKIDIGDSHVVCFDVSSRCRGNTVYFKQLGKVLDDPDAPGVVMRYLLSRDLSDFEPQEIPKYLKWCGENSEKPFSNNITGKKFSDIAKLRESGLGDMKEFSDIPQDDLPENETTDIPIFNMPETIPQKIILSQPERQADKKNTSLPNIKNTRAPVASTSGTSETSKLSESIEPINEVVNLPPKEMSADSSKPINEVSSAILLARVQREERLRKRVVELGEDPDVFMTITKKDRLDSIAF
uniref:NrS-1 polymerase-like helicase domain-containing protein n=1 Tax=Rhizophagus irregularis (strain DAOM 181602 / DAOM 197198 / MUCL 43194) TaxID=747089 RepID=U9T848_RHIID